MAALSLNNINEPLKANNWRTLGKNITVCFSAIKETLSIVKYILFIKFFDNCPTLRTRQILS